jgi:Flp pilus assembly protein TadG
MKSERGAVLVELALVAMVLATLVTGVFEIGMAWSDHQSLTQSSRSGARVGSQLGTSAQADNQVLRAVEAGLGDQIGDLTRIVIYQADTNGDMPAACVSAAPGYSGGANCNVYGPADLAVLDTTAQWGSGTACGPRDGNWCSVTERNDAQATASYLGVYVEIDRPFLTGLFGGGSHTMTETTVMRIEPAS